MKILSIEPHSSCYRNDNNISSTNSRQYNNVQSNSHLIFTADVSKLNKSVFLQRRIIGIDNDLGTFIDRIVNKIYMKDVNRSEKKKVIKLVEEGKIALGTSLYTNLLQPAKPMGACIVLPYDNNKSKIALKQELEPHILNGVGAGFDFGKNVLLDLSYNILFVQGLDGVAADQTTPVDYKSSISHLMGISVRYTF